MAALVSALSLLAIYFAAAVSLVRAGQSNRPPAIFVFGDSLSDVGNNNVDENFYRANFSHYGVDFPGGAATGRFTNGYNFVDVIAGHMGFRLSPPAFFYVNKTADILQGVNFASGGSGILVNCMDGSTKKCITMEEQIANFKLVREQLRVALGDEASADLISRSIFLITGGSNDLNNFFSKYILIYKFAPIDEYVANMTSALQSQLQELYDGDARKFAIINVPAIGMIPSARALERLPFVGADIRRTLNGYAGKFNEREYMMLVKLRENLAGMRFSVGNAYAALMEVTSDPEKFNMKDVISPCCGEVKSVFRYPFVEITHCSPTAQLCSNRSDHAFWDNIHPTQRVIRYASKRFYSGNATYARPVNLKRLVEDGTSRGVADGRRSISGTGAEATATAWSMLRANAR